MIKIKTRFEEDEIRYDVYRDGIWYHHTGYAVEYTDGSTYGEFEDSEGNVEYFN